MYSKRMYMIMVLSLFIVLLSQITACVQFRFSGKSASDVFSDAQVVRLANAVCSGNVKEIDDLVASGVDVNSVGYRDMSLLVWGMECKSHAGVESLLIHGADPNYIMKSSSNISAMWLATISNDPSWIRMLIKYGGNPNIITNGKSLLMGAVLNNDVARVGYLATHGADVNYHDIFGDSAGTEAAGMLNFDCLEVLLNHGYVYRLHFVYRLINTPSSNYPSDIRASRNKVLKKLQSMGI